MEGVGSRLGRASSRYGPAATVFSGPVRKWKKKWVHVSQSSVSYQNSHSQSNGHNNNSGGSRLLLCRWTPITSTTAAADTGSGVSAEEPLPPRRKFRYTPIAVLEEQKKATIRKAEDEANQSTATPTTMCDEMHRKPDINDDLKNETPDSNISHLDLGLCLKGHGNLDSVGQNTEGQLKSPSSSGFWPTQ